MWVTLTIWDSLMVDRLDSSLYWCALSSLIEGQAVITRVWFLHTTGYFNSVRFMRQRYPASMMLFCCVLFLVLLVVNSNAFSSIHYKNIKSIDSSKVKRLNPAISFPLKERKHHQLSTLLKVRGGFLSSLPTSKALPLPTVKLCLQV